MSIQSIVHKNPEQAMKGPLLSQKQEGIDPGYYRSAFKAIDKLEKQGQFRGNKQKYLEAKYIIANLVFFVHERLEKKITRHVNYTRIREWSAKNSDLARYLLSEQFPDFEIDAFDKWAQPETELMKMGMYSPSTPKTKHIFH